MKALILGMTVVLTIVFATAAFAAGNSPVSSVYDHPATKIQNVVGSSPTPSGTLAAKATAPTPASSGASLPFTGLDLGFLAGAGILLVAMGYSLRRVTRKPPSA
jgi:hypothetical protein